jgi:hypothetical protein
MIGFAERSPEEGTLFRLVRDPGKPSPGPPLLCCAEINLDHYRRCAYSTYEHR